MQHMSAAGAIREAEEMPVEAEAQTEAAASPEEREPAVVTLHPRADRNQHLRIIEAVLFASPEPVDLSHLKSFLPEGADVERLLIDLQGNYANRGVHLLEVAGKWMFRTAEDLGYILRRETVEQRKLSKAALETLAIIAYHQPVTRAEIEDIRGVAISKGTLDMLLEIGWVRMRGRRKTPGRPVTYGTTDAFLSHFGLAEVADLRVFRNSRVPAFSRPTCRRDSTFRCRAAARNWPPTRTRSTGPRPSSRSKCTCRSRWRRRLPNPRASLLRTERSGVAKPAEVYLNC